jgi:hypothetical protein
LTDRDQPLKQFEHCLESKFSGVTRNMLLHWIQTRCSTRVEPRGGGGGGPLCALAGAADGVDAEGVALAGSLTALF